MSRIEVLTGPVRQRRWSDEQKQEIVSEAFAPGAKVRDVARRADVGPGQIYRWRRELAGAQSGFAQVMLATPNASVAATRGESIDIEFFQKARVRIPANVSPDLAGAIVKALAQR